MTARVSRFTEEFDLSSSTTAPSLETMAGGAAPSKSTNAESSRLQAVAAKAAKAIEHFCHSYKNHFNHLVIPSSGARRSKYAVEAGSTSYGAQMASEKDLERQAEQNYLMYVFGTKVEDSITEWDITSSSSSSSTATTTGASPADSGYLDSACLWAQAYEKTQDDDSIVERINNKSRKFLSHSSRI